MRVLVAAQQGSKQAKNAPTLNFPRKHREVEGGSVFCLFASLLYTAAPEPSSSMCVYWLLKNSILKWTNRIFVDLLHMKKAYEDLDRRVFEILKQAASNTLAPFFCLFVFF